MQEIAGLESLDEVFLGTPEGRTHSLAEQGRLFPFSPVVLRMEQGAVFALGARSTFSKPLPALARDDAHARPTGINRCAESQES